MSHPPGMVGVIAHDAARFSLFGVSMSNLDKPEGSTVRWKLGVNLAENLNRLVRDCLDSDADWLWLLGDDHAFESHMLTTLLDHDVDIVVPLCLRRWPPFQPVFFVGESERRLGDLNEYPDGGLIEIHSVGSGAMLIRREVLESMRDPWFEYGALDHEQLSEDLWFCDKARLRNFRIWCDLDLPLGHITSTVVWPQNRADGWSFGLGFPEGMVISMPPGVFV